MWPSSKLKELMSSHRWCTLAAICGCWVLFSVVVNSANSGMLTLRARSSAGMDYFQGQGVVTGANQKTNDLAYVLSCWQANNLTKAQKERYQFHVVDVDEFGAVGDGKTLNTQAFQKASHAASVLVNDATEIAIVKVSNGSYKVGGTLDLYSNTFLYLDHTAVIVGSFSEADFPYPEAWDSGPVIVRATHQKQVGIFGHGTLDGGALTVVNQAYNASSDQYQPHLFRQYVDPPCQGECRPQLVLLENCDGVVVQDVTLQNSPDQTLHVRGSSNALLTRLRVQGDWRWPNNVGVNIKSCHNVTLSHSNIQTADDAICVQTTEGRGTLDNLWVTNNTVKSRSSAFKIGNSTQENVTNVFVDDLTVLPFSNRGIAIEHRDGGNISNVHIRNVRIEGTELQPIKWRGFGEPIYITSNPRSPGKFLPLGTLTHVTVEKVRASFVAGTSYISWRPVHPDEGDEERETMHHLAFLDVKICMNTDPSSWNDPFGAILKSQPSQDWQPTDFEPSMFPHPKNQQIGWYLNRVCKWDVCQWGYDKVLFQDCEVFFPPQPSSLSSEEMRKTPVCFAGDPWSMPGLTCEEKACEF